MSEHSAFNRSQLLRILVLALIAAFALMIAVAGMVAYSAHVVDRLQQQNEIRLAERRVERKLVGLRDDVVSATVWNDAYAAMRDGDLEWMQVNFGDYYADYMEHEVTVAYERGGRLVYASRDSEPVETGIETAFSEAVAPLVATVRQAGAAKGDAVGLDAVATREGVVMVGGEPYFVTVSTVVREDDQQPRSRGGNAVVASGMKVASFVPTLTTDLALVSPTMTREAVAEGRPAVVLRDPAGTALATLTWVPARPGGELLMSSVPILAILLGVMIAAIAGVGWRVYGLITELALNEEALDRSLADAETANAAKSQFLANMSHELRTPLNGVIAMTELLRAEQTDERARQMADTIVASGRTLEHVVNDILDVSKIEAGQMKFDIGSFDLAVTLKNVADLHGAAAAAKGVRLELDIRPDVEGLYEGDRNRVCQVFSNLLSNAVKFTDQGCVRISARSSASGLRIAVTDSGVGFDRATASRLFQRFEQADVSVSRRFGGTGLGLSISHSLVQMMGGHIAVRSMVGRGSVFVAHIPLKRLGAAPEAVAGIAPAAMDTMDGASIRILFADDHEVNRKVVTMILEPLGVDLFTVENGALAVEAASTSTFDIILMDVQMPVMDGLTATRQIRAMEARRQSGRTPIISLTANAMPDDIARSVEAGSNMHLAKPIRPDALIGAIHSLIAQTGQERAASAVA